MNKFILTVFKNPGEPFPKTDITVDNEKQLSDTFGFSLEEIVDLLEGKCVRDQCTLDVFEGYVNNLNEMDSEDRDLIESSRQPGSTLQLLLDYNFQPSSRAIAKHLGITEKASERTRQRAIEKLVRDGLVERFALLSAQLRRYRQDIGLEAAPRAISAGDSRNRRISNKKIDTEFTRPNQEIQQEE